MTSTECVLVCVLSGGVVVACCGFYLNGEFYELRFLLGEDGTLWIYLSVRLHMSN